MTQQKLSITKFFNKLNRNLLALLKNPLLFVKEKKIHPLIIILVKFIFLKKIMTLLMMKVNLIPNKSRLSLQIIFLLNLKISLLIKIILKRYKTSLNHQNSLKIYKTFNMKFLHNKKLFKNHHHLNHVSLSPIKVKSKKLNKIFHKKNKKSQ